MAGTTEQVKAGTNAIICIGPAQSSSPRVRCSDAFVVKKKAITGAMTRKGGDFCANSTGPFLLTAQGKKQELCKATEGQINAQGTNVCKGGFTKRLDIPNGFLRIFSEMTDPLTKIPSLATIKVLINSEPL